MKTKREILKFQDIKRVCDNLKNGYLARLREEVYKEVYQWLSMTISTSI